MKGLIMKDLFYKKANLGTYIAVFFLVFVLSIMILLSMEYGNMREEIDAEGLTRQSVSNIFSMLMFLPMGFALDIEGHFVADKKFGFYKHSSSFPVSVEKRVLSRYIVVIGGIVVGAVISCIYALFMGLLSDLIVLGDMFRMIVIASSIMIIYSSQYMCMALATGGVKLSGFLTLAFDITLLCILEWDKLKLIFTTEEALVNYIIKAGVLAGKYWYVMIGISAAIMALSYFLAVFTARRKRGVL